MKFRIIMGVFVILFTVLLASLFMRQAHAAPACAPFAIIEKILREQFKAVPRWKGQAVNGRLYLIFSNLNNGYWAAVMVNVEAKTGCILVEGRRNEFMIGKEV